MAAQHEARTGRKVGADVVGGVTFGGRIVTAVAVTLLGIFLVVGGASTWSYFFHSLLVVLGLICLFGAWDVVMGHRSRPRKPAVPRRAVSGNRRKPAS